MAIADDYLSTSLRWSLFKADWPEGAIEFHEASAEDLEIPKSFRKDGEMICVATLTRFPNDPTPIVAFKSESSVDTKSRDTDGWHSLTSKAMGRALKKAGYPDRMADLKVLMNFRKSINPQPETIINNVVQPEVKSQTATIAGVQVETPVPVIENKERPSKPNKDWATDIERDEAHRNFKIRLNDLSEVEVEKVRQQHEKLNKRAWPMPKADLNNLITVLETIWAEREGIEVDGDDEDKVASNPLKFMYEMLTEEGKEMIAESYGNPDDWAEHISESLYEQMMDAISSAMEE
jgi:hypothetical protein